ncbi:hypothetical protein CSB11_00665 [Candidatus Campbellbacteria bacterium]|nr:MAG: hypothetical protein CSB11_00665 [Candidatus Campbellbacteria bacterium]
MKKIIYSAIFLLSFLVLNTVSASTGETIRVQNYNGEGPEEFFVSLSMPGVWSEDVKNEGIMFTEDVYKAGLFGTGEDNDMFRIVNLEGGGAKLLPKEKYNEDKKIKIKVWLAKKELTFEGGERKFQYSTAYKHPTPIILTVPKITDTTGPEVVLKEITKGSGQNQVKIVKRVGNNYVVENNIYTSTDEADGADYANQENKLKEILKKENIIKSCKDTEDGKDYKNDAYTFPVNPWEAVANAPDNTNLTIRYSCKDDAGNVGSVNLIFKKGRVPDQEPPKIKFTSHQEDGGLFKVSYGLERLEPGVSCFDDYDNENKDVMGENFRVKMPGEPSFTNTTSLTSVLKFTSQNPKPAEGTEYQIDYYCKDKKGLQSEKITRTVRIVSDKDIAPPTISKKNKISLNQGETFVCAEFFSCIDNFLGQSIDLTNDKLSCSVDQPSGVNINNVTSSPGEKVIKATCKDDAGNDAIPKYKEIKVHSTSSITKLELSRTRVMAGMPVGYIVGDIITEGISAESEKFTLSGEDSDYFRIDGRSLVLQRELGSEESLSQQQESSGNISDNVYNIKIKVESQADSNVYREEEFEIRVFQPQMVTGRNGAGTPNSDSNRCKGWAWSSNVGWLSLNCTNTSSCNYYQDDGGVNYGVDFDDSTGDLKGYAWSPNVGWLKMGGNGAKISLTSGNISGASYFENKNDPGAGPWEEGGIKYSGANYVVKRNTNTKKLKGCAWGGTAVGWMCFSNPNGSRLPKLTSSEQEAKCSGIRMVFDSVKRINPATNTYEDGLTRETQIKNYNGKKIAKFKITASGVESCTPRDGTEKWRQTDLTSKISGGKIDHELEIDDLEKSTSFSLECKNGGDVEIRNLFLIVAPDGPKIKFTVSDTAAPLNSKVNLDWKAENVSECIATSGGQSNNDSGWAGHQIDVNGGKAIGSWETQPLGVEADYLFVLSCRSNNPSVYGYNYYSASRVVKVSGLGVKIEALTNPVPFNHPIKLKMTSTYAEKCKGYILDPINKTRKITDIDHHPYSDVNYKEFKDYRNGGKVCADSVGGCATDGGYWFERSPENYDYEDIKEFTSKPITEEGKYLFKYECSPITGTGNQNKSDEVMINVMKVPTYIEV